MKTAWVCLVGALCVACGGDEDPAGTVEATWTGQIEQALASQQTAFEDVGRIISVAGTECVDRGGDGMARTTGSWMAPEPGSGIAT